jgi:hypothetical protein
MPNFGQGGRHPLTIAAGSVHVPVNTVVLFSPHNVLD